MSKPKFTIDLSSEGHNPLEALQALQMLDLECGNHVGNGLRSPLGIYNISIARLASRLENCCSKLEELFKISAHIKAVNDNRDLLEDVLDYLEFSLYAAAEHVDDAKSFVLNSVIFTNMGMKM